MTNSSLIHSARLAPIPWSVVEASLWLRVGFVGACLVAASLSQAIGGDMRPLIAAVAALAGAVVATFALRRSWSLLVRDNAADVDARRARLNARAPA